MSEQMLEEPLVAPGSAADEGYGDDPGAPLRTRVRNYERALLVSALTACGGHQRRAAEMLGILPTTLHEKLKRHGLIPRPPSSESEAERS